MYQLGQRSWAVQWPHCHWWFDYLIVILLYKKNYLIFIRLILYLCYGCHSTSLSFLFSNFTFQFEAIGVYSCNLIDAVRYNICLFCWSPLYTWQCSVLDSSLSNYEDAFHIDGCWHCILNCDFSFVPFWFSCHPLTPMLPSVQTP